jgi:hypothetical protein
MQGGNLEKPVVQYAELNLSTSTRAVPGTSATYRLPVMMPGVFHITATGHPLAHFVTREVQPGASATGSVKRAVNVALARPGSGNSGVAGGTGINIGR